jgi:hypothetical protein
MRSVDLSLYGPNLHVNMYFVYNLCKSQDKRTISRAPNQKRINYFFYCVPSIYLFTNKNQI